MLINLNAARTGVDRPSLTTPWKSRNLLRRAHTSALNDGFKGMVISPQRNEEPVLTATLPWHGKTLASLTIYGEISVARIPEEFASLRMRLQQEWTFNGGIVSRFSIRFLNS